MYGAPEAPGATVFLRNFSDYTTVPETTGRRVVGIKLVQMILYRAERCHSSVKMGLSTVEESSTGIPQPASREVVAESVGWWEVMERPACKIQVKKGRIVQPAVCNFSLARISNPILHCFRSILLKESPCSILYA